jgi:hypothetical protein
VDRHLPRTRVIHAAACGQDGQLTFHIDPRDSESSSIFKTGDVNKPTLSVQGLSLESIIKQSGFDRVDLLKVDIEGAEVQLLANARAELLAGINQIVIEFHDFNGIITLGDVASTVQHLRHEGFFCMKFSRSNHDWLAIRPDRVGWNPLMPMLAHLWHRPKHLLRYKLSGRYNTHN